MSTHNSTEKLTPSRKCKSLTLLQKAKIIEESKKPGFNRNKAIDKYGITESTMSRILSKQDSILHSVDKDFRTRVLGTFSGEANSASYY